MPELKPVAWARRIDLDSPEGCLFVSLYEYPKTGYSVPLYAIPADQVLVPRELIMRAIALAEDAMGVDFSEHDAIRDELRALLHP